MIRPEHHRIHTLPKDRIHIALLHYDSDPSSIEVPTEEPPSPNSKELRDLARKVLETIELVNQASSAEEKITQQKRLAKMVLPYRNNTAFIEYLAQFRIDPLTGVLLYPTIQLRY